MEENWDEPNVSTDVNYDRSGLESNGTNNTYNNVNTGYKDWDLTKSNGHTYNHVNTGYNNWDLSKSKTNGHVNDSINQSETNGANDSSDQYQDNGLTNDGHVNTESIDESWENAISSNDQHITDSGNYTQHNSYSNETHNSWGNEIETNTRYKNNDSNRNQSQNKRNFNRSNGYAHNATEEGNVVSEKPKSTYIPPDFEEDDNLTIEAGSNFIKYDKTEVKVSGMEVAENITSFKDSGLRKILLENLTKCHYNTPTPIQKYALPIILSGRDMIASAQTGSGKTAAFVLPILNNLLSDPSEVIVDYNHCEPQALIMSPTRELAIQICEVATRLSRGTGIKSELLYGGTSTHHQKQKILRGPHIIVATPGRLVDFVNRGLITFSSIRFFIFDEADRMLDMGFQVDVERVLNHPTMIPSSERTTLMFSATLPESVQQIAKSYLKPDYVSVAVGDVGGACKDVTQIFENVNKFQKKKQLLALLNEIDDCQGTIVFVEQKRQADFIAAFLSEMNFPTTSIHGDREQPEREKALKDFKTKKMKILVATAVAARGLDIMGVTMVVNFDLPKTVEEYVHRIGRTGRLGNSGKAVSFYDSETDQALVPHLVNTLKQADQEIPEFFSQFRENYCEPANQFNDIRSDVTVHSEYINQVEEEW